MSTKNSAIQAQAEAAFIEGCHRLADKYKTTVKINMEEFYVDFGSKREEDIVALAIELSDLYDTIRIRFYGRFDANTL